MKCGTSLKTGDSKPVPASSSTRSVLAPSGAASLKCPSCGAPIAPKFGEMVITCEYCGYAVALGSDGWSSIQKQTMLPLTVVDKDAALGKIHNLLDRGFLHRHLQEDSTLEEMNLTFVPYWVIPVSARTSIIATDAAAQAGSLATTAALIGVMGAMGSGRRGGFGGPLLTGAVLGTTMAGRPGNPTKTYEVDNNYNFPIVALKALTEYQPRSYQFRLDNRAIFDVSKVPKGIKILNGDVGEDAAKYQAKTLVDQLQSEKAHSEHHMIQRITTESDVADGELLYVPIWFARYDHKGNKMVLILDGNSGEPINIMGV